MISQSDWLMTRWELYVADWSLEISYCSNCYNGCIGKSRLLPCFNCQTFEAATWSRLTQDGLAGSNGNPGHVRTARARRSPELEVDKSFSIPDTRQTQWITTSTFEVLCCSREKREPGCHPNFTSKFWCCCIHYTHTVDTLVCATTAVANNRSLGFVCANTRLPATCNYALLLHLCCVLRAVSRATSMETNRHFFSFDLRDKNNQQKMMSHIPTQVKLWKTIASPGLPTN